MTASLNRILRVSLGWLWLAGSLTSAAATFSYSAACRYADTLSHPVKSPDFPAGGTFSATPGVTVNPTTGIVNIAGSPAGTYTITYFSYTCNCPPVPITATLAVLPSVPLTVDDVTICAGSAATIAATHSAAVSFSWNTGATASQITVQPSSTAVYSVTATDTNNCVYRGAATVEVIPFYTISVAGNFTLCSHESATLSATGAPSFTWSDGSVGHELILTDPVSGKVTVRAGRLGCITTKTISIDVRQSPALSVEGATTCPGVPVTLSANVQPENATVSWMPAGIKSKTITVSPHATQVYTAVASQNGCIVTFPVTVELQPRSAARTGFLYRSPSCTGKGMLPPTYEDDFSSGGKYVSGSGIKVDMNTGEIDLAASIPGNYTITYTVGKKGCSDEGTGTATVALTGRPELLLPAEITILSGDEVRLVPGTAENFSWSPAQGLSCYQCGEPVAFPQKNTVYCVTATIGNCEVTDCVQIRVACFDGSADLSVPNAFSPNDDGENDLFCLRGWNRCIASFDVRVFDRWGELVYASDAADFCWDGIFKGTKLNADVYVFTIVASFTDGQSIKKTGNITLLR